MEYEVLEYRLSTGLLDRKRELRLTPDYIEYENLEHGRFTRILKEDIQDIKNEMNWIIWYRFYVGCSFSIDIKTKESGILKINFTSYFRQNKAYMEAYATIVDRMWQYYLNDVISLYFQEFLATHNVKLGEVKLNNKGVYFIEKDQLISWGDVAVKEYEDYFAIYNQLNPHINKRIMFNQWGSDILFSLLQSLSKGTAGL